MRILKYKKQINGKYKIVLDNNQDLLLYEDTILKYNLLIKGEISTEQLKEITDFNFQCDVYYVALKSLKSRFKSVKELKNSLIKKEYPKDLVDNTVNRLIKEKYLDDRLFSKSYINNQIITTSKGPKKISIELTKKGVSKEIINDEIKNFTEDDQIKKIDKVINKLIKSNRSRGSIVLKNKISTDLINMGYDLSIINKVINNYSFKVDKDIYQKEYNKLYKKLSKKYQGIELEYKIKEKLYQKGLLYNE
ncbi:MAG: RecX family transcriptional regulator [Bacilli bacterium]|nr:RecX family transcriptional regulator [Bacilli bacterium]